MSISNSSIFTFISYVTSLALSLQDLNKLTYFLLSALNSSMGDFSTNSFRYNFAFIHFFIRVDRLVFRCVLIGLK